MQFKILLYAEGTAHFHVEAETQEGADELANKMLDDGLMTFDQQEVRWSVIDVFRVD